MSAKYEMLKNFYDEGLWDQKRLKNAVSKNWITAEEYKLITGEDYKG